MAQAKTIGPTGTLATQRKRFDLHRHLDTSHSPSSIARVANELAIPHFQGRSTDDIRREIQAPSGATWDQWYECLKRVRLAYASPTAIAELARDVVGDAANEGLGLLELRVSLLSTTSAVMDYNAHSKERFWPVAREIMDALIGTVRRESRARSLPVDLTLSISCQGKYASYVNDYITMMRDYRYEVTAVDLTNERDNTPSVYKAAIDRIRPDIPFLTIHCMEVMGPERGWDALTLSPQRLGHGIRAIEDPKLVEAIREKGIALEVCPLSNLLTGLANGGVHPFRRLDESGLILTINHDGLNDERTLSDDYDFVQKTFGYSDQDMDRFAFNAVSASFRNRAEYPPQRS